MNKAVLTIRNISKSFDKPVLTQVNLTLQENEITALQGPSGMGKTTLLRILCGLETADEGEILLDNQPLKQSDIGLVFQNYQLFPHRSVLQNLMDPVINLKIMNKKEAEVKALELLTTLNLTSLAHKYPYQLSGGQKQRTAILRALMLSPKILCFDEPTSALDKDSIDELIPLIQKVGQNRILLIVTHDDEFAKRCADRCVQLKDMNKSAK